jgi:hypothetical protein
MIREGSGSLAGRGEALRGSGAPFCRRDLSWILRPPSQAQDGGSTASTGLLAALPQVSRKPPSRLKEKHDGGAEERGRLSPRNQYKGCNQSGNRRTVAVVPVYTLLVRSDEAAWPAFGKKTTGSNQ